MKNLLWLLLVPAMSLLISCEEKTTVAVDTTPELNMDSVRMKISAMEAAFAEASNRKDHDAVLVYYADDAQSMPPDAPVISGKDAIKARIQQNMASDTTGITMNLATTGVWAAGNYATETGTWTDMNKDGKVVATGKYMTLFELRNGKYVAIRDIWNRDAPKEMPVQ